MDTEPDLIDLGPAAQQVAAVAAGVADDQLDAPTPCPDYTVGDLLGHLLGVTVAFGMAARKERNEVTAAAPEPTAANLPPDWRRRLPRQLDELAAAWREPAAWQGEAEVGGVTMPAADAGVVALDELAVHGWDVARATGQPYAVDPVSAEVLLGFTTAIAAAGPEARAGLFGPPVAVDPDAAPFERALGLAGRDPAWTAP